MGAGEIINTNADFRCRSTAGRSIGAGDFPAPFAQRLTQIICVAQSIGILAFTGNQQGIIFCCVAADLRPVTYCYSAGSKFKEDLLQRLLRKSGR